MDNVRYNCLCLRSIDYRENDKLITLYAIGKGQIFAAARGVKKPKSRLKFAAMPLCFGAYEFAGRGGKYTLTGCELYDSFFDAAANLEVYYLALAVGEIMLFCTKEDNADDSLAVCAVTALKNICYKDGAFLHFCRFALNGLDVLGFGIDFNDAEYFKGMRREAALYLKSVADNTCGEYIPFGPLQKNVLKFISSYFNDKLGCRLKTLSQYINIL